MTIEVDGEGGVPEVEDGAPEHGQLDGLQLRGALEAILLVVDEPADPKVLAQVLTTPEPAIVAELRALQSDYDEASRGFELREIAGGWRLYTRAEFAPYVERFVLEGQQARLTQAALETLAVVAYRQPVSRTRVSAVRGVNVDGVMRTLVSRGLVEEAGADHESGAILYRTSRYFLERLGLGDLTELPNLADFLPESTTIDALEDELSSEG
jgi:segregation and condensation protein B